MSDEIDYERRGQPSQGRDTPEEPGDCCGNGQESALSGTTAVDRSHSGIFSLTEKDNDDFSSRLLDTLSDTVFLEARRRLVGSGMGGSVTNGSTIDKLAEFKDLLYGGNLEICIRMASRAGRSLEEQLGFLEKAARSLGDDWNNDSRSFIDVTIAMGRLQMALRRIVLAHRARWKPVDSGTVLFTVPSGEAHHFGQILLEEVFRARGWATRLATPSSAGELVAELHDHRVDIACFSWSTDRLSPVVATAMGAIEAMNPVRRPAIIAGGAAAQRASGWIARLGVDFVCDSAYRALETARNLIEIRNSTGALPDPRDWGHSALDGNVS